MILDEIVVDKKRRLLEHKKRAGEEEIKSQALQSKRIGASLFEALKKDGLSIIGEFKQVSPSTGILEETISFEERIKQYNASVDAISCLTEEDHFHGNIEYLKRMRKRSSLPILRKDFVIDAYQIYEAKVIGADAILLIAAILSDDRMREYYSLAASLSLDVLLEVHDEWELERALKLDVPIIGVNNRNLKDFSISLQTTKRLSRYIPKGKLFVSESGVTCAEDITFLKECGVDGLLIGRALMESKKPESIAKEWKKIYQMGNAVPKREHLSNVKICGLMTEEDIVLMNQVKPEYVGMVMFCPQSKRNLTEERVKELLPCLDPGIKKVAVIVSPDRMQLAKIEELGFDLLQVHGELLEEVLIRSSIPIFRAYSVKEEEIQPQRHEKIIGYVLDGREPGSGKVFEWQKMREFDRDGKLLILAGGLTEENVRESMEILCPNIVDVSSGVEKEDGVGKDGEKVRAFLKAVREGAAFKYNMK